MPNRRADIAMTHDELGAFLAAGRALVLVTTGPDGAPDPVPMWYVLDRTGRPLMRTYARSQKVANLRREPRAAALVDDGEGYGELRGVQLTGRVEICHGADLVADTVVALATKYQQLTASHTGAARQAALAGAGKQVVLRLHAERVVSWDHRKLQR